MVINGLLRSILLKLPKKLELKHMSGCGRNSEIYGIVTTGRQSPARTIIMPILLAVLPETETFLDDKANVPIPIHPETTPSTKRYL